MAADSLTFCYPQMNHAQNFQNENCCIMQAFLSMALSSLSREQLETVRSAFFCM